jgi:hypothetical protein
VQLSLKRNPLDPLPSNFSTVLRSDLAFGLSLRPDRIEFGTLGGATSSSGSASTGTSIIFSVLPSTNSSESSLVEVLEDLREQFYQFGQNQALGPLLQGEITSQLNTAYLVVISTGEGNSTSSSSSTADGQSDNAAAAAPSRSVLVTLGFSIFALAHKLIAF